MKTQSLSFDRWICLFVYHAVTDCGWSEKAVETFDIEAYRHYYNGGYTPYDAISEDMSYGE